MYQSANLRGCWGRGAGGREGGLIGYIVYMAEILRSAS